MTVQEADAELRQDIADAAIGLQIAMRAKWLFDAGTKTGTMRVAVPPRWALQDHDHAHGFVHCWERNVKGESVQGRLGSAKFFAARTVFMEIQLRERTR